MQVVCQSALPSKGQLARDKRKSGSGYVLRPLRGGSRRAGPSVSDWGVSATWAWRVVPCVNVVLGSGRLRLSNFSHDAAKPQAAGVVDVRRYQLAPEAIEVKTPEV